MLSAAAIFQSGVLPVQPLQQLRWQLSIWLSQCSQCSGHESCSRQCALPWLPGVQRWTLNTGIYGQPALTASPIAAIAWKCCRRTCAQRQLNQTVSCYQACMALPGLLLCARTPPHAQPTAAAALAASQMPHPGRSKEGQGIYRSHRPAALDSCAPE